MIVNRQLIKAMNPCDDRFQNYVQYYGDSNYSLQNFLLLNEITLKDKVWVAVRLMSLKQKQKFAIICAMSVIDIFETMSPLDKRPRLAIEAAVTYINSPNESNRQAAAYFYAAASTAAASANADAACAAAYATYTAADAAASTDAAYATYVAYAAADAAASTYAGTDADFILTIIEATLTEEL